MTSTFLTLVVIPVVYSLIRRGGTPAPVVAGASDEELDNREAHAREFDP